MTKAEKVLLVLLALAAVSLVTPVMGVFARRLEGILGLPGAMVWVLLWMGAVFVSLLFAHRTDPAKPAETESGGP